MTNHERRCLIELARDHRVPLADGTISTWTARTFSTRLRSRHGIIAVTVRDLPQGGVRLRASNMKDDGYRLTMDSPAMDTVIAYLAHLVGGRLQTA